MTFHAVEAGKTHDYSSNLYDISVQRDMHREQWMTNVKPKIWRRLIRDPRLIYDNSSYTWDNETVEYDRFDSVDHLYNEQIQKRFHPPVLIRILIQEQTNSQELGKLGIWERRPAIAKFSTVILEEMGFSPRSLRIGDIIEYEGHEYTLDTVIEEPESHWLETGIPFVITCALNSLDRQVE